MRPVTRKFVLEILDEPKTIQELADIMGVHYQTAYRYVRELTKTQDAIELPVPRENGQLVFVKNKGQLREDVVMVAAGERLLTLTQLVQVVYRQPHDPLRFSASLLAYLYRRAFFTGTDREHEAGIMTGVEARAELRAALASCRRALKAFDQALEVDELWAEGKDVLKLFGDCDPNEMYGVSGAFFDAQEREKTQGKRVEETYPKP